MEFFYVYDGDGNIVRSIDIFAQKEYTYVHEEGRIVLTTDYGKGLLHFYDNAKKGEDSVDTWSTTPAGDVKQFYCLITLR